MSSHPVKDATERSELPTRSGLATSACSALSRDEARIIEGYAAALQDLMYALTGGNGCNKSYDPMTVSDDGATMHSYAFDMLDGGRHHSVTDYVNLAAIKQTLLREAEQWIRQDFEPNVQVEARDE